MRGYDHLEMGPSITDAVCRHLAGWYLGARVLDNPSSRAAAAVTAQQRIGWGRMLFGRISKRWRDIQEVWLTRIHTKWRSSGAVWGRKFCKLLLQFHFSLWEHRNDALHSAEQRWKQEARGGRIAQMETLSHQLSSLDLHRSDRWLVRPSTFSSMEDDGQIQWITSARQALTRATPRSDQPTLDGWVQPS